MVALVGLGEREGGGGLQGAAFPPSPAVACTMIEWYGSMSQAGEEILICY